MANRKTQKVTEGAFASGRRPKCSVCGKPAAEGCGLCDSKKQFKLGKAKPVAYLCGGVPCRGTHWVERHPKAEKPGFGYLLQGKWSAGIPMDDLLKMAGSEIPGASPAPPPLPKIPTTYESMQAAVAFEKVKGAIRTLDMANSWEAYASSTASGHSERLRVQLDLIQRAVKQDRMAPETAKINAGSFKHAEGIWNALQRATEAREEAFATCLKAVDEALVHLPDAWSKIISFVTSFGDENPRLWEPTQLAAQLRGDGLWQSDFDPVKGWVPRPNHTPPWTREPAAPTPAPVRAPGPYAGMPRRV